MTLTCFLKMKIVIIVFVLLGCNLKNKENVISKRIHEKEQQNFEIDSLEVKDKDGVIYTVKYYNDSIHVCRNEKNIVKIVYFNRSDEVFPVNGLIVNDKLADGYITDNHILLLPLSEVNNRLNLIAIDLINKAEIEYQFKGRADMITTGINCFYYNEKNNFIVGTNSLNYEGKTTVHYYKISKKLIVHKATKELDLTPEMLESNEVFLQFLNTNNNKTPY